MATVLHGTPAASAIFLTVLMLCASSRGFFLSEALPQLRISGMKFVVV